jgi:hypothetical protein
MTHSVRRLAAGSMLVVTMAAMSGLTAASALAAPARTASPARAATAAVAAAPAGTGPFSTWRRAQRAAGFRLRRPTYTAGLRRAEPVLVEKCLAAHELSKRNVLSLYGSLRKGLLVLEQNNSGHPCGDFGEAKKLGTYRIEGAKATLWGSCGAHGMPPCSHKRIALFLEWRRYGIYRLASSYNERKRTLLRFARGLKKVR